MLRRLRVALTAMAFALSVVTVGITAPAVHAYSCTVTPAIWGATGDSVSYVSGKVKWGPTCSTAYANTIALYYQTGYNDWNKEFGESLPNMKNQTDWKYMYRYWPCDGVGVWRVRAEVGGVVAYSSSMHCPPMN